VTDLMSATGFPVPVGVNLTIDARVHADGVEIHVAGELDLTSRALMLLACVDGDQRSVVVDLTALTFMDCAGYGALVRARVILEERGGTLGLVNATGEPLRLLGLIDRIRDGPSPAPRSCERGVASVPASSRRKRDVHR
jgi:anti-anti-sigma factor